VVEVQKRSPSVDRPEDLEVVLHALQTPDLTFVTNPFGTTPAMY
jgi:hypothetical protein